MGRLPIGGPPLEPEDPPEAMGGGASPAELSPDATHIGGETQDPIDLVSDTSESSDDHSDCDDSSAVVVIEPTDQASAEVPCLADLLTTSDFTQYLLNDPRAPMVSVSLEEQALAPAPLPGSRCSAGLTCQTRCKQPGRGAENL